MRPLVILPTYDEAENIVEVLGRIQLALPSADVLVVDDGSPDGTADLAEQCRPRDRISVCTRRSHTRLASPSRVVVARGESVRRPRARPAGSRRDGGFPLLCGADAGADRGHAVRPLRGPVRARARRRRHVGAHHGFQIEMAYNIARRGGRIVEVPITFNDRERGSSKMSSRIVVEALLLVTWWAIRDRILRRPLPPDAS